MIKHFLYFFSSGFWKLFPNPNGFFLSVAVKTWKHLRVQLQFSWPQYASVIHVCACSCRSTFFCQNENEYLICGLVQCVSDRTLFPFGREQSRLSSHWAELEKTADKRQRPPATRSQPACVYLTPGVINRCVTRITARVLWHVPSPSQRSLVHVLYGAVHTVLGQTGHVHMQC